MRKTLRIRTTVLPGGRVEIVDQELPVGETVEVVISPVSAPATRSAWQIISEGPEQRLFHTAEEVREYLAEEKASWDR